jgi:hypothetical protein
LSPQCGDILKGLLDHVPDDLEKLISQREARETSPSIASQFANLPEKARAELADDPYANLDVNNLDDEERARLDAALEKGMAQIEAGQGIPFEQVLARLRRRATK